MRKLHSVALVLAAVPLMMGGCFSSSNSNNAASQQPPPPPPPVGFKALFQPLVGVFPYPNDFFFQGSTDGTLVFSPCARIWPYSRAVQWYRIKPQNRTQPKDPIRPAPRVRADSA